MAFGLKYVQGTEKEQFEKNRAGLIEEDGDNPSPSRRLENSAPSTNINPKPDVTSPPQAQPVTSPSAGVSRFRRNLQSSSSSKVQSEAHTQSEPSRSDTRQENRHESQKSLKEPSKDIQADPPKKQFSFTDLWREARESSGEAHENENERDEKAPLPIAGQVVIEESVKSLQARRMIQEIADFKKWDLLETEKAERDAMRNPDETIKKWIGVYKNEVKAFKIQGARSLEEGVALHPGSVVFLLAKKDSQKLRVLPAEDAGFQSILHGARLESVPLGLTPFKTMPQELLLSNEKSAQPAPDNTAVKAALKP